MEFTFSQLKQKDVINLGDGKNLGRVCDLSFRFPENNILGITVTGGKGFKFTRQEVFIPIKCVEKIGEDAVLVNLGTENPHKSDKRPPKKNPPQDNCNNFCPPDNRRSYDEYE